METFIRLDMKGHWRGVEHRSSMNGLAGEWDDESENSWESGISCYSLKDAADAIENLRAYWMDIATMKNASDYRDFQVTIFEGEKVGTGSDYEDLATCEKTLVEAEAKTFMERVIEAYEMMEYDGEIDEKEYKQKLRELVAEYIGVVK